MFDALFQKIAELIINLGKEVNRTKYQLAPVKVRIQKEKNQNPYGKRYF